MSVLAALALAFLLGAPSVPVAALPPTAGFAFADEVEAAVVPGGPPPAGRALLSPINGPEPAPGVSAAPTGAATPAAWLDWDALDRRKDNRCEGDEEDEDGEPEESDDRSFWGRLWDGVKEFAGDVVRWIKKHCGFFWCRVPF